MATVHCIRCGQHAEGLTASPFRPGTRLAETGQRIYENICGACYKAWLDMSVKLVNEMRMDTTDPRAQQIWLQQMEMFLNLDGSSKDPWSRLLNQHVSVETSDGRKISATLVGLSPEQLSFAEFDGGSVPEGFTPSATGAQGSATIVRDRVVTLEAV